MTLSMLKNFIEIVDSGSMTAAAKKVFVAQSALSNQLKALENEMGTVLLIRTSRYQTLTQAGKILYEKAKHMLSLESAIKEEIAELSSGQAGTLRLGLIPSAAVTLLDGILTNFANAYPRVRFELYEVESHEVLTLLENGVVDLGIVRTPFSLSPAMTADMLGGERMIAAYNPACFSLPTAGIHLTDLKDLPLIVIQRYESLIRNACAAQDIHPRIRCVNRQLPISLLWARQGIGIAIVPLSSYHRVSGDALVYAEIDEPSFDTQRALVRMKDGYHSALSELFYQFCRDRTGLQEGDEP